MAAFNAMAHEACQLCKHMLFAEPQSASRSAYATSHEGVTYCGENSSGCAPDPSLSGSTDAEVLLKLLLIRCELEAAHDCPSCKS